MTVGTALESVDMGEREGGYHNFIRNNHCPSMLYFLH